MFHLSPEASKVCMAKLVEIAKGAGLTLSIARCPTLSLTALGAREVSRDLFLDELAQSLQADKVFDRLDRPWQKIIPDFTLLPPWVVEIISILL